MGSIAVSTNHETPYKHSEQYQGQPRAIKIIIVGAGISGIAAVKLFKDTFHEGNVELVIYEKNHDIVGTWLENRYPG
jgi:cation diffusion facilitator CzcD-associated flavoprotein CzcO